MSDCDDFGCAGVPALYGYLTVFAIILYTTLDMRPRYTLLSIICVAAVGITAFSYFMSVQNGWISSGRTGETMGAGRLEEATNTSAGRVDIPNCNLKAQDVPNVP